MIRKMYRSVVLATLVTMPAHAMVGGAPPTDTELSRAIVTIVGSRGNFCSGALIAPRIVLTAAHCVTAEATYKIVDRSGSEPKLLDVSRVARHPSFDAAAIAANRASADVALMLLAQSLPGTRPPLATASPSLPLVAGTPFRVIGIGVTARGDGRSGGIARSASLIATGRPGTLQIRLVDPSTNNSTNGLGACTGDSGGPVLQIQNGRDVVIGVVSWSTAARNAAGCGGLTGVTPLTLYRAWIVTTVKDWGGGL